MNEHLISSLTAELGAAVVTDAEVIRSRRHDYWAVSHLRRWLGQDLEGPGCVVRPTSTAEVQALVRFAAANAVALVPFGLGSGVCGGVLPTADVVLVDLGRMDATRSIVDTDLLATFEAGKVGIEAEEEVAARGLTIGHWPQSIAVSSVGGWVSTRASGQFSTAYGNIEDVTYGIEAVLPTGEVVHLGKAPRASAGPDLRHLVMGAEGTMGIVTAVTFSLRAAPERRGFSAFHATTMADGIDAQRLVMRADWRPPVMRLYDAAEARRHFPDHARDGQAILILVHEGPASRVEAEIAAVTGIAVGRGLAVGDPQVSEMWLGKRNHVPDWSEHFARGHVVDTIEVSAPWSRIGQLYEDVTAAIGAVPGVVSASAHSSHVYRSGINLYFSFAAAVAPEDMEATYFACWRAAMEATAANGGGIAHHHGAGRLRKPYLAHDLGPAGVDLLRQVKAAVDPASIMNPGNLIPD